MSFVVKSKLSAVALTSSNGVVVKRMFWNSVSKGWKKDEDDERHNRKWRIGDFGV